MTLYSTLYVLVHTAYAVSAAHSPARGRPAQPAASRSAHSATRVPLRTAKPPPSPNEGPGSSEHLLRGKKLGELRPGLRLVVICVDLVVAFELLAVRPFRARRVAVKLHHRDWLPVVHGDRLMRPHLETNENGTKQRSKTSGTATTKRRRRGRCVRVCARERGLGGDDDDDDERNERNERDVA